MRSAVIQRILSRLLLLSAAALVPPLGFSLIEGETAWTSWAIPAGIALVAGAFLARRRSVRRAPRDIRRREGFLAVVLAWMVLVVFTAVAFHLTGEFVSFAEAFFESMSGYTTTGATVIGDVDALPVAIKFMRSWSHWIGGVGIIVLSVAILPELAVGGMQLFSAESTGIDSDKLAPRIAATARRLWGLYVGLTAVETVFLLLGGLSLFDAVNHAMSTIATGGFSTRTASVGAFDSVYVEMVVVAFMFIGGIGFTLQYRALVLGDPRPLLRSPEVRLYAAVMLAAFGLVALSLHAARPHEGIGETLRYASFQTVSIMTTTGFTTADFDMWPDLSRIVLVGVMLIGGCAGSTAGGSKVIRLYVVIKHALLQLHRLVRPRLVAPLQIGDRPVPRETTEAVLGYYLLYFAALMGGSVAMTALGLDLVSGTTASVSAMNSIGPALGSVGAVETFAGVPDSGLYLLSFGMLLGRLEIYTVLVLLSTQFWRRG